MNLNRGQQHTPDRGKVITVFCHSIPRVVHTLAWKSQAISRLEFPRSIESRVTLGVGLQTVRQPINHRFCGFRKGPRCVNSIGLGTPTDTAGVSAFIRRYIRVEGPIRETNQISWLSGHRNAPGDFHIAARLVFIFSHSINAPFGGELKAHRFPIPSMGLLDYGDTASIGVAAVEVKPKSARNGGID